MVVLLACIRKKISLPHQHLHTKIATHCPSKILNKSLRPLLSLVDIQYIDSNEGEKKDSGCGYEKTDSGHGSEKKGSDRGSKKKGFLMNRPPCIYHQTPHEFNAFQCFLPSVWPSTLQKALVDTTRGGSRRRAQTREQGILVENRPPGKRWTTSSIYQMLMARPALTLSDNTLQGPNIG